ncbi:MFS transporter [Pseudorhodoferax sp.]|uniref:MFS transporter n=1 Tax=Pseudorhodoferax sp. TaxID=1993553 RepID=UPI0039E26FB4
MHTAIGAVESRASRSEREAPRALVASSIGNLMEWYDFAVYGYMAAVLGTLFFPSGNPGTSLLFSFATFGAAFVVRPLGAVILGPLGDKIGRRNVLSIAVLGISAATFCIGLLPTYASLGVAAPILLVLLRLVQGFCAGGEVGGAITYIVESAPMSKRGFYASWIHASAMIGFFLGLSTPMLLTALTSTDALHAWVWRVPFLIAGPIGLIGLYIRLQIEETEEFRKLDQAGQVAESPVKEVFTRSWRSMLLVAGVGIPLHLGYFMILIYVPSYLRSVLHYDASTVYFAAATAILVGFLVIPPAAILSDKIGRKPGMLITALGFVVATVPLFHMIQGGGTGAFIAMGIFGFMHGCFTGFCGAAVAEIFATRNRSGGLSIGHNLASIVFGGGTPFLATYLVGLTGNALVPAYLIVGGCLVSLIPIAAMKDLAGKPLRLV